MTENKNVGAGGGVNKEKNPKKSASPSTGFAVSIFLFALAVFIAACLLLTDIGTVGEGIRRVLLGLFSYGAYAIPLVLCFHAICFGDDVAAGRLKKRAAFSSIIVILASCVDYAVSSWNQELTFSPALNFTEMHNGGFVGTSLGFFIGKLFGQFGIILISVAVLAIVATFFYAEKAGALGKAAMSVSDGIKKLSQSIKTKNKENKEKKKQIRAAEAQQRREAASEELLDDEFFRAKGDSPEIKIKKLGIDEEAKGKTSAADPRRRVYRIDPEIVQPTEPKRKKAERTVNLSYGIDGDNVGAPKKDEPKFDRAFFGLDDSADSVFTKDFDPFNFATSERTSAKYAQKVSTISAAVEEELDEFTIYEMKANHVPTDREIRLAQLEERKKAWLYQKQKREGGAAQSEQTIQPVVTRSLFDSVTDPAVKKEPAFARSAAAFGAASDPMVRREPARATSAAAFGAAFDRDREERVQPQAAPQPIEPKESAPAVETVQSVNYAPQSSPAPAAAPATAQNPVPQRNGGSGVYTPSFSNTTPAYNRPIKTVEFTITKEPTPAPQPQPVPQPTAAPVPEATEDVAILISQKVAKNNPTYMRSANDMRTFSKVISTAEDDELYRQLSGTPAPAPVVNPAPVEEPAEMVFEPEVEVVTAEPKLPETVEFSIGDKDTPAEQEPSAAYQRAAAFASSMVNQSQNSYGNYTHRTYQAPAPAQEPVAIYTPDPVQQPAANYAPAPVQQPAVNFTPAPVQQPAANYAPAPVQQPAANFTPATVQQPVVNFTPAPAQQPAANFTHATVQQPVMDFTPAPEAPPIQSSSPATMKVERSMLSPEPKAAEPLFSVVSDEEAQPISFTGEADKKEEEVSFSVETPDYDAEDEEEVVEHITPEEIAEEENVTAVEIPPEKQNPDVIDMRNMFPFLANLDAKKEPTAEPTPAEEIIESKDDDKDDVPFDDPVVAKKPASVAVVPAVEKKEKEKKEPDFSGFRFPSIDILTKEEALYDENINAEIQENADKLIETLASFNVTASIKGVDRGPRITRYEVVPAKGVKVSQIMNLQDDIALALAVGPIRMEAPIPGKSAVGIEIPNKTPSIVRLRNLLETADFQSSQSKTFVCIGRDVVGQPVFGDLAKMPHLLIAGATGMGKSVCINSLLISILYKARPDEVKLIMIDPKQVEFTMYNGIPHLLVPVVSDPKQAAGALMWAVEEMERRYDALNSVCVRSIDIYNEKVKENPELGKPFPKIIIVIDEFADLMLQVKDPVETLVMRIAQKARAAGIHLVIGTQRPSVNVITGVIKANVPSRISCKVMSNVDSKTVLDSAGAEKLLDRGDSLYAPAGSPKPHRVQCAFVADGEVEAIMDHLKQFGNGTNYDTEVMEEIERAAQKCSKKGGDRGHDDDGGSESGGEGYLNDRQFLDAVEVAVNTRKISTSLIQRKLSIGYGKAAKFIDIMEDMGIVGEANGQRPREVLLTPDEWREKLARASLD